MERNDFYETYTFQSVSEIVTAFTNYGIFSGLSKKYIFRGEKSSKYKLIPSVLRENNLSEMWYQSTIQKPIDDQANWEDSQISLEYNLLKQFYDYSDRSGLSIPNIPRIRKSIHDIFNTEIHFTSETWLPDDLLELAGLAQHYGTPTRLLDWSYDYRVALYFASIGVLDNQTDDSVLWAINYHYFEFTNLSSSKSPLVFIRPPYNGNKNLEAQKGLFSYWKISKISVLNKLKTGMLTFEMVNRMALDDLINDYLIQKKETKDNIGKDKLLYRFIIPIALKIELLEYLYDSGYSENNLFPGFHGVVKHIENKGKLNKCILPYQE